MSRSHRLSKRRRLRLVTGSTALENTARDKLLAKLPLGDSDTWRKCPTVLLPFHVTEIIC